jgi:tartronate-semialdehyde synthase
MIEELAVGAQHNLPYLHIVVNNSYLGLIRQAQRGFQMDFEVSLAFDNINARTADGAVPGYGVDHVAVAEGLGCKAIRVKTAAEFKDAFARAHALMEEHQVPVVLEFILERVTNISMGTEVDNINEFEEILCLDPSLSIGKGQDMDVIGKTAVQREVLVER